MGSWEGNWGYWWWEMFTGEGMGAGPLNAWSPIMNCFVMIHFINKF